MINLFYRPDQALPDNAGRAVSAWAWGASRAMDYLQTDPDIDPAFPYRYPTTYKSFGSRVSASPVDQHELLALVAPRRLVIASALDDTHSDPDGEFLSYLAAAQVYALYGLGDTGLSSTTWPTAVDKGFRGPAVSYHRRTGDRPHGGRLGRLLKRRPVLSLSFLRSAS